MWNPRRAFLKIKFRKKCGFDSLARHQTSEKSIGYDFTTTAFRSLIRSSSFPFCQPPTCAYACHDPLRGPFAPEKAHLEPPYKISPKALGGYSMVNCGSGCEAISAG
jgi:hypothetical protein